MAKSYSHDNINITRLTTGSSIQVNHVQPTSPLSLPVKSRSYRVFRENSLLAVITLIQPDTFAALNINSWNYLHVMSCPHLPIIP
jgi:hypothetical protein